MDQATPSNPEPLRREFSIKCIVPKGREHGNIPVARWPRDMTLSTQEQFQALVRKYQDCRLDDEFVGCLLFLHEIGAIDRPYLEGFWHNCSWSSQGTIVEVYGIGRPFLDLEGKAISHSGILLKGKTGIYPTKASSLTVQTLCNEIKHLNTWLQNYFTFATCQQINVLLRDKPSLRHAHKSHLSAKPAPSKTRASTVDTMDNTSERERVAAERSNNDCTPQRSTPDANCSTRRATADYVSDRSSEQSRRSRQPDGIENKIGSLTAALNSANKHIQTLTQQLLIASDESAVLEKERELAALRIAHEKATARAKTEFEARQKDIQSEYDDIKAARESLQVENRQLKEQMKRMEDFIVEESNRIHQAKSELEALRDPKRRRTS